MPLEFGQSICVMAVDVAAEGCVEVVDGSQTTDVVVCVPDVEDVVALETLLVSQHTLCFLSSLGDGMKP